MIQEILTVIVIAAALIFLGKRVYTSFFSKKKACEGCAVSKMHQQQ